MSHPWEQLVLGGVDTPRFLVLNETNFCNNRFFSTNVISWVNHISGVSSMVRTEHTKAYGQYMLNLQIESGNGYIEYVYDYGSSIADKIFLFSISVLNLINLSKITLEIAGSSVIISADYDLNYNIIEKCFIVGNSVGQTGNEIKFRIYGVEKEPGDPGDANIFFDNIMMYEVINDYSFNQPHDSGELIFNKDIIGESTLLTGMKKEYNVKWIPNYICTYEYLNNLHEQYRQELSECPLVFCLPHKDANFGFLGKWGVNEFIRSYSFNRFFGHFGIINIIGCEYFINKPISQSSDVVYIEDDLLYI